MQLRHQVLWLLPGAMLVAVAHRGEAQGTRAEPAVEVLCTIKPGNKRIDGCGSEDGCMFQIGRRDSCPSCAFELIGPSSVGITHPYRYWLLPPRPASLRVAKVYGRIKLNPLPRAPDLDQQILGLGIAAQQFCSEDGAALRQELVPLVKTWLSQKTSAERYQSNTLTIEPWGQGVKPGTKRRADETSICVYKQLRRVKQWVFVDSKECQYQPLTK